MKTNYETPSIELIEIEIEDAILNMSDFEIETNEIGKGLSNFGDYEIGW